MRSSRWVEYLEQSMDRAAPGNTSLSFLENKSNWLRQELFEMVMGPKKGHVPSCFSMIEIAVTLYYGGILSLRPHEPNWPERDRIIVSKGHAAMAVYPILADLGFFSKSELTKFSKRDGLLRMYGDRSIPGIESTTGSLGHGFGIAAGFALSAKKQESHRRSFCILGDGECHEGSIWETALFAAHHNLNNFTAIVDNNGLCILGKTQDCLKLEPLADKWQSFGWNAQTINGHSHDELSKAFQKIAKESNGKPSVIIANTIKGKGISYMEDQASWHNKMPNQEQMKEARRQLGILTG